MDVYKKLKRYIQKVPKFQVIIFFLTTIILIALDLVMPYLGGMFIDLLTSKKDKIHIINFAIFISILSIIPIILGYLKLVLDIKIQSNLAFQFNHDIIKHMQKVPFLILQKFDIAYLSERINTSANEITKFF